MVAHDTSPMATGQRIERPVARGDWHEWHETKTAFKTTEFLAYLATVVGVIVLTALLDSVNAWDACLFLSALTIGYMLSRGLAKAGTHDEE